MKFRAKLIDIQCIHQFTKLLTTVSKVSKTCTMKLSETQIVLTQNERATNGGCSFWCEINQKAIMGSDNELCSAVRLREYGDYFDEYRIEGKDDKNEIYLEVVNENIVRAIKSGQSAQSIKIKLTKKQTACLTFEVVLPSLTSHTRNVVHDVPVALIPTRYWEDFQKPCLPNYDMKISMPHLKCLKNIVERMKNISGYMVISASADGEICFKVETPEVTATTYFKNMEVEDSQEGSANQDENSLIAARVDIQKLSIFLNAQQVVPAKTLCGIVHGRTVHFFLQCNDFLFQYFVPAMNVSFT